MTLSRSGGGPSDADGWVAVGVVARPHALRGAILVKPFTRSAEEFLAAPIGEVHPRRRGAVGTPLRIVGAAAVRDGLILLELEGVEDRTAAEALAGAELVIPEAARWPLPEDEFYVDDLVGMMVHDQSRGRALGAVLSVEEGAQPILVVAHPDRAGASFRLPFVAALVPVVDRAARRIEAVIPEGLLDL